MDSLLTVEETLSLIFDRTNAVRELWNFYIAVTLGILGVIGTVGSVKGGRWIRSLMVVGFLLFALSNLSAMRQTQSEREGLIHVLKQSTLPPSYEMLVEKAGFVWPSWKVIGFHSVMDLVVSAIILCAGRRGPGDSKKA